MDYSKDDSTIIEKWSVVLSAFGCSCAAFFLAAIMLVPVTGMLFNQLGFAEPLTIAVVFLELFALPVAAALYGIHFAARPIIAKRLAAIDVSG